MNKAILEQAIRIAEEGKYDLVMFSETPEGIKDILLKGWITTQDGVHILIGEEFGETGKEKFANQMSQHHNKEYAGFLTKYSKDEYEKMNAKCYLSANGKSGFAVKADGDIISVFSAKGEKQGVKMLNEAIRKGGNKLDCFDGFLAKELYPQFGFEEYKREKWDDKYAPENWNYERDGRPDIVYMKKRGV